MTRIAKLLAVMFVICFTTNVWAYDALTSNREIFVHMVNGAKFNGLDASYFGGSDNDAYYIKAAGGGLNALHITTTPSNVNGQATTVNSPTTSSSGTFYISNTGGRVYNDSIILMISVKGTINPNFTVNIKSGGYAWSTPGNYPGTYTTNVINQTFTASDFSSYGYGSNVYKPGPGALGVWSLPLWYGQTDFTSNERLLFIDLKVGNLNGSSYTDYGTAKVEYSFTNLDTSASFNAYAWCLNSNQGQGINWTQQTSGTGSSGYTVNYTP